MSTICNRCILDSSFPNISFDADGICNICHNYNQREARFSNPDLNKKKLNKIIDDLKREGKGKEYDLIQGVSGGRDSTYCLHLLKEWGLRPLAVHFDNNMDSKIAAENIKNLCTKLDVDLHTFVVDWEEYKDLQKSFFKASVPSIDLPLDHAFVSVLYQYAYENDIPVISSGYNFRGEGPIPDEWSCFDTVFLKDIHSKFGAKPLEKYPIRGFLDLVRYRMGNLRIFTPLNFVPIDYQKIMPFMEQELGWKWYGGHHFESIFTRWAFAYYLPKKFGIDKRITDYSVLVRSGQLSRQDALNKMQEVSYSPEQEREDRRYIMNKLEIEESEMEGYLNAPPKKNSDYAHHLPIITRIYGGFLGPRYL